MIHRKIRIFLFLMTSMMAGSTHAIIISASQNAATQGAGITEDWRGVGSILFEPLSGAPNDPILDQWCTGTVLNSRKKGNRYVLTAAHCLFDGNGTRVDDSDFPFNLPEPGITGTFYGVKRSIPHEQYDPIAGVLGGFDIALLELFEDLVDATFGWNINRGEIADERAGPSGGLVGHKVGFGLSGDGVSGATGHAGPPDARQGFKRTGVNHVDRFGPVKPADGITDGTDQANKLEAPADTLIYDFDDHVRGTEGPLGGPAINATEADTAPGDSGGPMFMFSSGLLEWLIVGVTSYGLDYGSRFGDIAVDTRVQSYAGWVYSYIPTPPTLFLAYFGIGMILWTRRGRRLQGTEGNSARPEERGLVS